ncbi:hypothetical protein V2J09_009147, partial [Rumex salicifolius]
RKAKQSRSLFLTNRSAQLPTIAVLHNVYATLRGSASTAPKNRAFPSLEVKNEVATVFLQSGMSTSSNFERGRPPYLLGVHNNFITSRSSSPQSFVDAHSTREQVSFPGATQKVQSLQRDV